jgi:DNA-binding ferritin-like protein
MPKRRASDNMTSGYLTEFFGLLHALYWVHWTGHWQSQGPSYYGDHLMFGRMYESMREEIDMLAEKMIPMLGIHSVDPGAHIPLVHAWIQRWSTESDPVLRSLRAEMEFQGAVKRVYDGLKENGDITLGMDDYLMSIANDHEVHLYLLKQRATQG